ncbi:MAG TPA: sulfotransferase [Thermoanaerobaculia bacterium]|nr:sulfotransferase [Thermoanaerobaculia bacterium]
MSASPVTVADVVVGLLTENTTGMLTQAIRLLRSIRWFGGAFANVRVVVCGVGELEAGAHAELTKLGAEIRTVTRFHPANPTANRQQLLASLLEEPEELMFLLDCDTIVTRDPLPYLTRDVFQAKVAPTPTVSDEVFARLFTHFQLPQPPRTYVARFSNTPMLPYFNAGVIAMPIALARRLAPSWRRYNQLLADEPQLVAPCQRHMHQASLTLALVESGVPHRELPDAMNYQLNATHVAAPPGYAETDPVIVHYHHLGREDGYLLPTPYPGAQRRIDLFHARLRDEGIAPSPRTRVRAGAQPIVVLGMHRSGTSLITEIVRALGAYAGEPGELAVADMFNPTGYWEHRDAVAIDTELLETLGANWSDRIVNADVSRLSRAQHDEALARIQTVVASLQQGGPFVLKDPRMSLLFPLWREALGAPVCILAWRHPLAVARSLTTRDKQRIRISLAAWEHHYRTILRDTAGLPRLLVSYEELLAEPHRVIQALHAELERLGIPDLRIPTEERIRQIVKPDFNRSGRDASTDESLLNADQHEVLDALRSGDALRNVLAPTAAHTFELLAEFVATDEREQQLRAQIDELDQFLGAVFESRSWRIGNRLTRLMRLLRPAQTMSVYEKWQEHRRRRS